MSSAIERVAVVVGARPNFVKAAPLLRRLDAARYDTLLVHTGQHSDDQMSGVFFKDLGIREPDVNLGVSSGTIPFQFGSIVKSFAEWIESHPVDALLVMGDVTSTIACSVVAAYRQIPVGHVEAGLRSFDRSMPEEINRVIVDQISTWLFTPSADADRNLNAEGVSNSRIHCVGNIMIDSLFDALPRAMERNTPGTLGIEAPYLLLTVHRPALVDDPERLRDLVDSMAELSHEITVVFPIHPRTRARLEEFGLEDRLRSMITMDPLGYLDFLSLEANAAVVVTDSGGVQEETTALGIPCLTARENTERPITVLEGTNRLVGLSASDILQGVRDILRSPRMPRKPALWDGRAAARIVDVLDRGIPEGIWDRSSL